MSNVLIPQTAGVQYVNFVLGQMPASLAQQVGGALLRARGRVLGMPTESSAKRNPNATDSLVDTPAKATILFPTLNLRARLAKLGPSIAAIMAQNGALTAALEDAVNWAITNTYGGDPANIDPTDPWAWVKAVNGPFQTFFPGNGTTFKLPTVPYLFFPTQDWLTKNAPTGQAWQGPAWFTVEIVPDPNNVNPATLTYLQGGTLSLVNGVVTASGGTAWTGTDPM